MPRIYQNNSFETGIILDIIPWISVDNDALSWKDKVLSTKLEKKARKSDINFFIEKEVISPDINVRIIKYKDTIERLIFL